MDASLARHRMLIFFNSRSDIVILDFVRILYIYMHNDAPAVVSFQILLMNDFPSFAIELL